jgi:hypothetical protein
LPELKAQTSISVNTGARFTITKLLLASFSAIAPIPEETRDFVGGLPVPDAMHFLFQEGPNESTYKSTPDTTVKR